MVFLPDYMTTMPLHDKPSSLWAFTMERYARPGVQHAAITLQEQLGADVNLLFYCAWHAASGQGLLDAADFESVETQIVHWREEITLPLRRLRTIIKNDPNLAGLEDAMDVRGKILGAEIESERVAQIAIESMARPPKAAEESSLKEIAESNLRAYLQYIDDEMNESGECHMTSFLNGVMGR